MLLFPSNCRCCVVLVALVPVRRSVRVCSESTNSKCLFPFLNIFKVTSLQSTKGPLAIAALLMKTNIRFCAGILEQLMGGAWNRGGIGLSYQPAIRNMFKVVSVFEKY